MTSVIVKYTFGCLVTCFLLSPTRGSECYSCDSASSHAECDQTVTKCPVGDEGSCMTEIRTNNGVDRITKRCKQTASCEQNEAQNANQCKGDNAVCYYCCEGDLCNGGTSTSLSSSTTTSEKQTTTTTASTTTTPILLTGITENSNTQSPQRSCSELEAPRYGSFSCTEGFTENSRCTISCDQGYDLTPTSSASTRCRCDLNGVCSWMNNNAQCTFQFQDPVECDRPDFARATLSVLDVSPTSAVIRVNVRPLTSTTNGWSIALMFAKALPQSTTIETGHMTLRTTSADNTIFTFNSLNHNADLSTVQLYSVHFYLKFADGSADASNFAALAGFYDKIIFDGSCIQNVSPVIPLPTTTPTSTTSTTTASTTVSATPPTTTTTTTAGSSTTQSTTATTTTTTASTTTTTTPTTTTTTTTAAPTSNECEVLSNGQNEPGYIILNSGWNEGSNYKFTARAQKFPDNKGLLAQWTMKVEFTEPVSAVQVYVATSHGPYQDGKVWLLKPMDYNDGVGDGEGTSPLQILMVATVAGGDKAPDGVVTFCRNGAEPNLNVGGGSGSPSTAPMTSSSATTTTNTGSTSRCAATGSASFGGLPSSSSATNPFGYTASTLESITTFDYNEILHQSILFYEAQRSGKQPANNRIPWRGDSGLKDGCDVGKDLTGGYYDAGDNVKFGFPMAYTATVLAWSVIEFQDSYIGSGDMSNAYDMIRWFSDYFVKAHTSKFELYVQVGDPDRDHGQWVRPEDITFVRKSYKIDQNNAGTEVAAETAAALAAASIVMRPVDASYADMLVSHARDLYEFADTYRKSYHLSVPSVANFYKSWSGFNDELLWGAVWLYKATSEQEYLNTVENRYDSYGGGNVPGEFSWDNKYAGVQVLLAQITEKQKYREDVNNFYNHMTSISTTPLGLTWQIQWGPNRYAANFAWISTMAAQLTPVMPRQSEYLNYARSQINYLLGMNEKGSSYVVGHMSDSPKRPHHRSSSCPPWSFKPVPVCSWNDYNNAGPNPHVLYGALVGGPDSNGVYVDDRKDFVSNEVAVDYNAGFQATVAGLQHFAANGVLQA